MNMDHYKIHNKVKILRHSQRKKITPNNKMISRGTCGGRSSRAIPILLVSIFGKYRQRTALVVIRRATKLYFQVQRSVSRRDLMFFDSLLTKCIQATFTVR